MLRRGRSAALLYRSGAWFLAAIPIFIGWQYCIHPAAAQELLHDGNAAGLRVSVVSNIASPCGRGVSKFPLEENAATRLSSMGITVSPIHNSQLSIDLDCVAVASPAHSKTMAVHECLAFSELVAALKDGETIRATTWRKCQSYMCSRGKCDGALQQENALLDDLLRQFRRSDSEGGVPLRPPQTPVATAKAAPAPRALAPHPRATFWNLLRAQQAIWRSGFYSVYIVTCLIVCWYWQTRKQHYG